jgi:hypothetical protein
MSDVYGFGVVLLEMLVGRRALEPPGGPPQRQPSGLGSAHTYPAHQVERIVDRRMGELGAGHFTARSLERVSRVAYDCLSQNPKVRPTMARIVQTLDAVLNDRP